MNNVIPVSSDILDPERTGDFRVLAHELANRSVSDNTRRAYRSAIRRYRTWGGNLPAMEIDVIRYITEHVQCLKPETLELHLSALRAWHSLGNHADPTRTAAVRKVLAGAKRTFGRPRKKARPLSLDGLSKIVQTLRSIGGTVSKRDSALLQVGFFGAFRRSELAAVRAEDIEWDSEGISILLSRSKTDQLGEGMRRSIPYGSDELCPVTALRDWLDVSGIAEGPVFRSIARNGAIGQKGLHAGSINEILARAAVLAGLPGVAEMSSHSLRRGMATSARAHGADLLQIKRQGGWRDDRAVQGYIDDADRFKNTAAGLMLGKRKDGS